MSSTQMSNEPANQIPASGRVDAKLEVVVLPVSDVNRAKRFYGGLGWRLDADFTNGEDWRAGADDPSRLTVLRHVRQGIHDGRAGLSSGNVPRRR